MNVAIAAMIAGCLRHRRRDHAVTRIHDTVFVFVIQNRLNKYVTPTGNRFGMALDKATKALGVEEAKLVAKIYFEEKEAASLVQLLVRVGWYPSSFFN